MDAQSELLHPFRYLSAAARRRAFVASIALTAVVALPMARLGAPLTTETAPYGIASFELAGDLATAQAMVESWGEQGRLCAGIQLGLDYLFLVAYATCIALGCTLVSTWLTARAARMARLGVALAWGALLSGALDAVENWALVRVLIDSESAAMPVVAWWCAVPKFLLVLAGLAYCAVGLLVGLLVKAPQQQGAAS